MDAEAERQAIAEARALPRDTDVPLADVVRWLESWGKPNELPPPPWETTPRQTLARAAGEGAERE
jgi:hypothetical protein